jgi:hypothetical protein
MAHLPAKREESSLTPAQAKVAELLANGMTPAALARKLAKGDKKKAQRLRARFRYWVWHVPAFQQALMAQAKGEAALQATAAIPAVGRRAQRGRVDATKLLLEVSGMHNPKVNHEHSGEVKITLATMPRPEPVETEDSVDSDAITEAEIVDE